MSFNLRVLATEHNNELYYSVRDVYYNSDGLPNGYSGNPITVSAESLDGLEWLCEKITECLEKPVLWEDDRFPQELLDSQTFQNKWRDHLEEGHYGLAIHDLNVINYLDKEFTKLKETVPNFTYSQIKLKFGLARVYMEPYNLINTSEMEDTINSMLNNDGSIGE
jgi:hypothetical protein